jgi:hypothetical protein
VVAEAVVDGLEVVEVHEDHRAAGRRDVGERVAVRQAGERVALGLPRKLGAAGLEGVGHRVERAGQLAELVVAARRDAPGGLACAELQPRLAQLADRGEHLARHAPAEHDEGDDRNERGREQHDEQPVAARAARREAAAVRQADLRLEPGERGAHLGQAAVERLVDADVAGAVGGPRRAPGGGSEPARHAQPGAPLGLEAPDERALGRAAVGARRGGQLRGQRAVETREDGPAARAAVDDAVRDVQLLLDGGAQAGGGRRLAVDVDGGGAEAVDQLRHGDEARRGRDEDEDGHGGEGDRPPALQAHGPRRGHRHVDRPGRGALERPGGG